MKRNKLEWVVAGALVLGGMALCARAQETKDTLFAGTDIFEKGATSVTDINMGPDGLGMVTGRHAGDAHRMLLNTVKTYEYDQPGLYNLADVDKFRQKLSTGDWSCQVHSRNLKTGESTDVCSKNRTDGYRESAIITVEKKELTFIHRIEKEGSDGHSDVSFGPVISGMETMPAMLALNSGRMEAQMAILQAKLGAGLAGMHGGMLIVPDGAPGGPHSPIILRTDKAPDLEGLQTEVKKLDSSKGKTPFLLSVPAAPAPASPETPAEPAAPPAPAPVQ